jgi:S1-C subfamily serine protease
VFLFFGCASIVNTTISKKLPSLANDVNVTVYGLYDNVPVTSQNIGSIRIGDSGFSVNCGWNRVIETAVTECRKLGGNALKITSISEPDFFSTCYRITAYVLYIDSQYINKDIEKTNFTEVTLKKHWEENGIDYIEGIYETVNSTQNEKNTIAVKRENDNEYNIIYLKGASSVYKDRWQEGDLKAKIYKTANDNIYKVDWYMADKSLYTNLYISFEKGAMRIFFTEYNREEILLKLYPLSDSTIPRINPEIISSGTGFALNTQGYIVTNFHVISNAKNIQIKGVNGIFDESYAAKVVAIDRNNDIAILKLADKDIEIKNIIYDFKSTVSDVGESVFALGYPLRASMGDEIKLTNGIISAKSGYQGDISNYQISVPVQPGNSGGPLFDKNGHVIGIITARHMQAENASYAIKISYLINLIQVSDEPIILNSNNKISNNNLTDRVRLLKDFVYIIECK